MRCAEPLKEQEMLMSLPAHIIKAQELNAHKRLELSKYDGLVSFIIAHRLAHHTIMPGQQAHSIRIKFELYIFEACFQTVGTQLLYLQHLGLGAKSGACNYNTINGTLRICHDCPHSAVYLSIPPA